MNQADWVGGTAVEKSCPFKDIRNTRESVAEEKARLCMELGRLLTKPPVSVINGSIQRVRAWRAAREAARKVAGSARSSTQGGGQRAKQHARPAIGYQQDAGVRVMRIEQLRIDTRNLSLDEIERYSRLFGGELQERYQKFRSERVATGWDEFEIDRLREEHDL